MAEPEVEEELEEEEDEDDEDEEEEEERRMADDRRDNGRGGRGGNRDNRDNRRDGNRQQQQPKTKDWSNLGLRSSWLKTIGPETSKFVMSRLAAALVRRGMKTPLAARVTGILAEKLGDGGVKNVLIPLLQITGNIPPVFRAQFQAWGLPHDSIDILNEALNEVFEAAYLEWDDVGTPPTTIVVKEPTFQDAVNQLDVYQSLVLDRIIQRLKRDPEASKKFEAFRSKLTQRRDLEMIIAFVGDHALGEDVPPAEIVAFIERRCGELPPKPPADGNFFSKRFGAIGKLAADLLPPPDGSMLVTSASSSLEPLHQAVANARWADARPIVPSRPSRFMVFVIMCMSWLRSTRLYNYFFDPPAPPAPPPAVPGGAAPGP